MKRALILLAIVACSKEGALPLTNKADGPVPFRVLSEKENAAYCREAPEFAVAKTEDEWIDIFDLHTECQPGHGEVKLPRVDFENEIAVAAWWKRVGCLGFTIQTGSVERKGDAVVVTATSTQPGEICATAVGQLESFYAFERSERFTGDERIVFVLDGKEVGTKPVGARS